MEMALACAGRPLPLPPLPLDGSRGARHPAALERPSPKGVRGFGARAEEQLSPWETKPCELGLPGEA